MKKRCVVMFLMVAVAAAAMERSPVIRFVEQAVTPKNAAHLGFASAEEAKRAILGPEVVLRDIDGERLRSYPESDFSVPSPTRYLPVLVGGEARCFVVLDSTGAAVAVGFRDLARELNKAARLFGVKMEEISLYASTQIASYLISVPVKAAPGTGNGSRNLIVLNEGWERRPSAAAPVSTAGNLAAFPTEAETIQWLKGVAP